MTTENGHGNKERANGQRQYTAQRDDPCLRAEERERLEREVLEKKIEELLPEKDEEDEVIGKAYDPHLVRRLAAYIRPYKRQMVWAVILMAVTSLLSVAGPWIVGRAVDDGIRAGSAATLRFWTWLFILARFPSSSYHSAHVSRLPPPGVEGRVVCGLASAA